MNIQIQGGHIHTQGSPPSPHTHIVIGDMVTVAPLYVFNYYFLNT